MRTGIKIVTRCGLARYKNKRFLGEQNNEKMVVIGGLLGVIGHKDEPF